MSSAFTASSSGWSVSYDWIPEPEVIAAQLDRAANNIDNMQIPLMESRDAYIGGIERAFESKVAPGGGAWAPWSESYAKYAEGDLMILSGDLLGGLTSTGAYEVGARHAAFTGDGVPEYWVLHQSGTSKMPARPVVGMDSTTEGIIMAAWEAWFDAVAQWDSHQPAYTVETTKFGGTRHRGAGGRFVGK